jgi:choline dehydrogenase
VLERGPATSPLFQAFFQAVQEAGYSLTDDVNGYRQEGFAPFDRNVHRGRRLSAARAYLHPVMDRPNLHVETRAFVTRILFDGRRAIGVEYRTPTGSTRRALGGEVILCGGAINTPQLLQLSGIGNADELKSFGIDAVADLPGVGENLQDHLEVYIQYGCKQPVSVQPSLRWRARPWIGANWLFFRSGPGATNHFEGGGFARSNDDVAYPNLMFHFLPIAIRYDGSVPAGGHGYQVHIGPMYSDVRGSVKIKSTDPKVHPALRFNYLSTDQDRREWVEAIHVARNILNQPAFDEYNDGELSPGTAWRPTSRSSTGWPGTRRPRCIPPAPPRWAPATDRCRPVQHVGARCPGPAGRGRLRDAVHHQRQHLRAGHDDGREGSRPDPREHPLPPEPLEFYRYRKET